MLNTYESIGRERAELERAVLMTAVENFNRILATNAVDVEPYVEKARGIYHSMPARYQAELRGFLDGLPIPEDTLHLYLFVLSDISSDIAGMADNDGCSNVVLDASVSTTGRPLVLKNRDVTGRVLRPQTVVAYPSVGELHGFLTVTSCGTPFVFQGVNRTGLVAANTFVDVKHEDVSPRRRIRNGVVVRRILEECATVEEAVAHVRGQTTRRMKGFTLSLADEERSALIEANPANETIRIIDDDIVVRTNHFPGDTQIEDDSSERRLARLREMLSAFPDTVDTSNLIATAMDHANGPGPNSICRHHAHDVDEAVALGQSTTVTSTLYQGGEPALSGTIGNPCQSTLIKYHYSENGLGTGQSGQRWEASITND